MKLLIALALISFVAHATTDISNFKGKTYKKEAYDICLHDYDALTRNVGAVEGYTLLDGGCLEQGPNSVRIEFNYLHPLASQISGHIVTYTDSASCDEGKLLAPPEIVASGNHFVASYCDNKTLTTNFINTTYSVVKSLRNLGNFSNKKDCLNFINELTSKSKLHKMTSLMSQCQEVKYAPNGVTSFSPVFNYISFYEIEVNVINGKTSSTLAGCLNSRESIDKNFTQNNVKLVYSYCAGAMNAGTSIQEIILFLKPTNLRYVVEYNGSVVSSQEACEEQMKNVISAFENAKLPVLYGHCKEVGTKSYVSSINYLKNINK